MSSELPQHGDAVVEAELFGDQPVLDLEDGDAGKPHRLAAVGRQRSDRHVVEGVAGLGATALPLADDVIALGDQVGRPGEAEVRERRAELRRERPNLVTTAARGVQRVLEADVRGGELVDHGRVEVRTPEPGEPATNDRLVVLLRHGSLPSLAVV